jgi:hypothetical protein
VTALPKGYTLPKDTPGPVEGGCGREGCGHAREDHYVTRRTLTAPGVPFNEQYGESGRGPCNMRGVYTHCICYAYVASKVLTTA